MSSEKAVIKLEKLFKVIYRANLNENYLIFTKKKTPCTALKILK